MTRNGRIALDPSSQPVLNLDDDGSLPNLMVDTDWAGGSDYHVHFSLEGGPSKLPAWAGVSWAERIPWGDVAPWFLEARRPSHANSSGGSQWRGLDAV